MKKLDWVTIRLKYARQMGYAHSVLAVVILGLTALTACPFILALYGVQIGGIQLFRHKTNKIIESNSAEIDAINKSRKACGLHEITKEQYRDYVLSTAGLVNKNINKIFGDI